MKYLVILAGLLLVFGCASDNRQIASEGGLENHHLVGDHIGNFDQLAIHLVETLELHEVAIGDGNILLVNLAAADARKTEQLGGAADHANAEVSLFIVARDALKSAYSISTRDKPRCRRINTDTNSKLNDACLYRCNQTVLYVPRTPGRICKAGQRIDISEQKRIQFIPQDQLDP